MNQNRQTLFVIVWLVLGLVRPAMSNDLVADAPNAKPDAISNRWLLLCCGLAGDEPHHERLTDACKKIIENCGPKLGIQAERLRVLAADEPMKLSLQETKVEAEPCTKESIQQGMQWLAKNVNSNPKRNFSKIRGTGRQAFGSRVLGGVVSSI